MMDGLGSTSRALLDAARDGLAPDAAAIGRVRAKVGTAVSGGAIAGSLAAKLGVLGLVAAVVTGAVLYARPDRHEPTSIVFDELRVASELAPSRVVAREEMPAIPTPPPAVAVPAPTAVTVPRAPRASEMRPAAPRKKLDLGREVALIDQAMAAMRRGDAAAALAAVRTHTAETAGAGQLAEDAAAIEVEALCRLHDANVATKLAAFDARWPESAQRSRLTTSCH